MLKPLVMRDPELLGWTTLSGDDPEQPFERTVGRACHYFSFSDYTSLFLPETIREACDWSTRYDARPFAMFFTIPDANDCSDWGVSFSGLVATGADKGDGIESFLMQTGHTGPSLSLYDISHRFIIVPDDRSWLWMGDRDADLAIFGFTLEAEQQRFASTAGFQMFASVDEAASHAKSFMNYSLDKTSLLQR
ncbi:MULTISPECIES: hypothetical protein [Luteibacter]|uniref:hypothetical protein n=1 Tax=Luteibacter TaxID=242605 RepID=UPI00056C6170|nr:MULTISPECIES: hypothetical protein [unclassified Luteibacter]